MRTLFLYLLIFFFIITTFFYCEITFAATSKEAYGVKEFVIDSDIEFNHDKDTTLTYFVNKTLIDPAPTGYFQDKTDLSDPNLALTKLTNKNITKLVLPGKESWTNDEKNTISPPSLGELSMMGWKAETNSAGLVDSNVSIYQDDWNNWSKMTPDPSAYTNNRPSLPVGGLNYILQSFKVYRTGQLAKIKLKVRRHPGVTTGTGDGLYITILADDGSGKNPKRYASGSDMKDVVLGYAKMEDNVFSVSASDARGNTSFENIIIDFKGVKRPILIAGKLYWMKISTIPYER